MKIKLADRFLMFILAVLVILAGAATIVLALFFTEISGVFNTTIWRVIGIAAGALSILTGLYLFLFLNKYRYDTKQFIVMQTDSGEMRLAVKAVENQVKKCTDMHEEMRLEDVRVFNDPREGVTILVKISMVGNVSIPLAVASLQKQVKQYLIASSGISVKEVKVAVDTMRGDANDANPYRLSGEGRREEASAPDEEENFAEEEQEGSDAFAGHDGETSDVEREEDSQEAEVPVFGQNDPSDETKTEEDGSVPDRNEEA